MSGFIVRNLKVFFKDKSAVFFSLLSVIIIIGLYALFLGDVWVSGFGGGMTGVRYLMDSWIMAGLLAVTSVTATMGAYDTMVDDKCKKTIKDFTCSPISRGSLVGGYIISSFIVGIIMSLVALVFAEIYIVANGGSLMDVVSLVKVVGVILLITPANSAFVLFLVSFFTTNKSFSTASTLVGTLIGFLTGIYLPIGNLPDGVQWVIKCFPVSHGAALFRQIMMREPLAATFAGAPAAEVGQFERLMGVVFEYGGVTASPLVSIAVLVATAAVFYALALWSLSRKSR